MALRIQYIDAIFAQEMGEAYTRGTYIYKCMSAPTHTAFTCNFDACIINFDCVFCA